MAEVDNVKLFLEGLKSDKSNVVNASAIGLGNIGNKKHIPDLMEALKNVYKFTGEEQDILNKSITEAIDKITKKPSVRASSH